VRVRLPAIVLLLALLLAVTATVMLTGCSERHHIEVQSDVCWDGIINDDQRVTECGNVSYKVTGKLKCVVLQKQNATGYLRVRIDSRAWSETTESFGKVQVCQ
jgi:hypothetical protein